MCDNLIRFVDGDIFHQQTYCAFALARRGLGIIPAYRLKASSTSIGRERWQMKQVVLTRELD
jgi:hypothetical protein